MKKHVVSEVFGFDETVFAVGLDELDRAKSLALDVESLGFFVVVVAIGVHEISCRRRVWLRR